VRPERDLLGPPCDGSAHGTDGVLVLPGGTVGLLPGGVVVVAVGAGVVGAGVVVVAVVVGAVVGELVRPGGVVDAPVGAVVGTTVRGGGTGVTGGTIVIVGVEVGAPVGSVVPPVDDGCGEDSSPGVAESSAGRGVCAAASAGGWVVRCLGLAGSGSGISGVSSCGPPRRLLAMRTR
jgi:hypothetical protein